MATCCATLKAPDAQRFVWVRASVFDHRVGDRLGLLGVVLALSAQINSIGHVMKAQSDLARFELVLGKTRNSLL